jgi:hypothetical protein
MLPSPRWQEATEISLIHATYTSTNPLYIITMRNQFELHHEILWPKTSPATFAN